MIMETRRDDLPPHIARLVDRLAELPGVVAVVLGGSRATGTYRPDSDWDVGVYYRSSRRRLDPDDVKALGHPGHVSALGDWGPVVHGGAWLTVDETPVDVLYRDLDTVERWLADAERGRFEILVQAGYLVGAPTYLPVGELVLCRQLVGDLPRPTFFDPLAENAYVAWHGHARTSLMFAHGYARAGDPVACAGLLADAVLRESHARLASRREWALNEKRLVARAGLGDARPLLASAGGTSRKLLTTVATVSELLGIRVPTTR